jgi:hypothetical protein
MAQIGKTSATLRQEKPHNKYVEISLTKSLVTARR